MLVLALVKSIEIIGVAGGDVVPVEKTLEHLEAMRMARVS